MVGITEISAIVAAAGVLGGVVYHILDIRNQAKLRQTDMVMRLYTTFGIREFQKAYQNVVSLEFVDFTDAMKKYAANIDVRADLYSVIIFFEGIGLLVKRKLINVDLVDDLFTSPISQTWRKMAPVVKGTRGMLGFPSTPPAGAWFEYLYNEMNKREHQLTSKTA